MIHQTTIEFSMNSSKNIPWVNNMQLDFMKQDQQKYTKFLRKIGMAKKALVSYAK